MSALSCKSVLILLNCRCERRSQGTSSNERSSCINGSRNCSFSSSFLLASNAEAVRNPREDESTISAARQDGAPSSFGQRASRPGMNQCRGSAEIQPHTHDHLLMHNRDFGKFSVISPAANCS